MCSAGNTDKRDIQGAVVVGNADVGMGAYLVTLVERDVGNAVLSGNTDLRLLT